MLSRCSKLAICVWGFSLTCPFRGQQGAFPGNLQLVLVLRPSRFLQRTIADIGIRLHRDDFKMKVPVSMLRQCSPDPAVCGASQSKYI